MVKFNNKGFFLAETIVITGIVAGFLAIFYFQISNLYNNYERNARYNTVESIHAANAVKLYAERMGTDSLLSSLTSSGQPLYDFTNYSFDGSGYFEALVSNLNIDTVYITQYNINDLVTNYTSYNIDAQFLDYLKTQKVSDNKANTYRIIVILGNHNYSSVLFSTEDQVLNRFINIGVMIYEY